MTLTSFVAKSAFRNKRRSLLTVASIAFSLLLLCIMLCVWRSFYIDKGAPDSALRIMTRHKVSLANFLPVYYRDKIRTVPGVVHVVPMTWFGGKYKDDKPENFFAQLATDPDEYFDVAADKVMPADQLAAWKRDRAGCVVDVDLARKHNWKIGDHIILQGTIFPTDLDLTVRGIYTIDPPSSNLYFHTKYLEESVDWFKDTAGFYFTRVDTAEDMPRAARAIDDMFHSTPVPTKSESEQAFKLDFINTLGSVKAFILSICGAVVVHHAAGLRQHHGHVDPRTHPRGGRPAYARLHPPKHPQAAAERIDRHFSDGWHCRCRARKPGHQRAGAPRHWPAGLDAHDPAHRPCRHDGCCLGRTGERPCSFLPRFEPRHRRRAALHRLT